MPTPTVATIASNPNDSTIGYLDPDSDSDSDDSESKDDMDDDDDDSAASHGDDCDEVDVDTLNYAKMVDSLLLEDDKLPVSYYIDWVKGKGAGQKVRQEPVLLNQAQH